MQVWISYDPAVIRPVDARPGNLLGEAPVEAGPIIDEVSGSVQYAAARIGPTRPPTPPGLFATMSFMVLNAAAGTGKTTLEITQVKIPDEDIFEIRDVLIGDELRLQVAP